jgi:protoporphyrinogen oxidase
MPRKAESFLPAIVDSSEKSTDHAPPGAWQVHCFTYGRRASEYGDLPDGKLAELMMEEVRRFIPSMPEKPLFYLHCRWYEAICLEPPGMLAAIERLRSGDCGKVGGLYFAGSYMRLLSSVEGSLRSGEEAVMDTLRYS